MAVVELVENCVYLAGLDTKGLLAILFYKQQMAP